MIRDAREELRIKLWSTFEGLISVQNLEGIWEKSCKAQPDLSQLYGYAEEVAFEFFEGFSEENTYQDSDVSDGDSLDDTICRVELGDWEVEHSGDDDRHSLVVSPSHITNGVPSEMVPENVMWDGREWISWNERTRPYSARQLQRLEDRKRHVVRYPCHTVNIIYTYEFDDILNLAGYSSYKDLSDLNTLMSILGWIHEINVEISKEWDRRSTTDQDELSIVWIIMGYKLLERRLTGPSMAYDKEWLPRNRPRQRQTGIRL